MAIVQRFMTVVKSQINHWIGRVEDPEKMLNQMLLDMQEQLISAKKQVAVSIADEKRLQQQLAQETQLAQEWEKRAMLAVRAGNDSLAKQALERQAEHQKQAQAFDQNWQAQRQAVDQLKQALMQLGEKIEEAKRKKNLLVARAKRADAQRTISETMSGISQTNAFDTISRMEEKIDRMEAEASATTELANEVSTDRLAAEFDKLEIKETDDALAELKSKMGLQAPPAIPSAANHEEMKKIQQQIEAEVSVKR